MRIKNKLFNRKKEYPRIDNLVVVYVAVVLYFQLLLQISPIVTSLTATPLYNIQTYLGLLGGGLIVLDLFTTKRIWQGNYIGLLCVILVFAALASVRMISYGIKENLFSCAGWRFSLFWCTPAVTESIKRSWRRAFASCFTDC